MRSRSWFPSAIEGRTVVLRPHTSRNVAAFTRWYADPEVARLTRYQDGPMRPDDVRRFFEARVTGSGSLALAIHLRGSDRLIGTCAFSQLDGDNGSALFHITIGEPDCWGHGYGTEATALMLEHAFGTLGLHRVGLAVFAFNERAIRSYRKVGFVARRAIARSDLARRPLLRRDPHEHPGGRVAGGPWPCPGPGADDGAGFGIRPTGRRGDPMTVTGPAGRAVR